MDATEIATLAVLLNELPDPDVLLYIQPLPEFATFTLFPNLPPEIRLMVYELTFKPRKVKIKIREKWARDRDQWLRSCYFYNSLPSLLQINREARAFGLKSYAALPKFEGENDQYFNPDLDTLQFSCGFGCVFVRLPVVATTVDKARTVVIKQAGVVTWFVLAELSPGLYPWGGQVFEDMKMYVKKAIVAGRFRSSCSLHIYRREPKDPRGDFTNDELALGAAAFQRVFEAFVPEIPDLKVPQISFS